MSEQASTRSAGLGGPPWSAEATVYFYGGPLSNFAATPGLRLPFGYHGHHENDRVPVSAVEHWFQACKATSRQQFDLILACGTAASARRAGRETELRPDWERAKFEVMLCALRGKFALEPYRSALLLTHPRPLAENSPSDFAWGCRDTQGGYGGQNLLGCPLRFPAPGRSPRPRGASASRCWARRARPTPDGSSPAASPAGQRVLEYVRLVALRALAVNRAVDPNDPDVWRSRDERAQAILRRHWLTQLSAVRLTLAAINELIAGQARADREAGLDWSTVTVPPAWLDERLRRAHATLPISLDDPAAYAHRADHRAVQAPDDLWVSPSRLRRSDAGWARADPIHARGSPYGHT